MARNVTDSSIRLSVSCVVLQLHLMALHDCGVLTLARSNVNIVATRKQLSVLRSVMKYQPVNSCDWINH